MISWPCYFSQRHEPIHVHGQCDGLESKAEFVLAEGEIVEIRITDGKGSRSLLGQDLKNFNCFVYHRSIRPETITRKLL